MVLLISEHQPVVMALCLITLEGIHIVVESARVLPTTVAVDAYIPT